MHLRPVRPCGGVLRGVLLDLVGWDHYHHLGLVGQGLPDHRPLQGLGLEFLQVLAMALDRLQPRSLGLLDDLLLCLDPDEGWSFEVPGLEDREPDAVLPDLGVTVAVWGVLAVALGEADVNRSPLVEDLQRDVEVVLWVVPPRLVVGAAPTRGLGPSPFDPLDLPRGREDLDPDHVVVDLTDVLEAHVEHTVVRVRLIPDRVAHGLGPSPAGVTPVPEPLLSPPRVPELHEEDYLAVELGLRMTQHAVTTRADDPVPCKERDLHGVAVTIFGVGRGWGATLITDYVARVMPKYHANHLAPMGWRVC